VLCCLFQGPSSDGGRPWKLRALTEHFSYKRCIALLRKEYHDIGKTHFISVNTVLCRKKKALGNA